MKLKLQAISSYKLSITPSKHGTSGLEGISEIISYHSFQQWMMSLRGMEPDLPCPHLWRSLSFQMIQSSPQRWPILSYVWDRMEARGIPGTATRLSNVGVQRACESLSSGHVYLRGANVRCRLYNVIYII